MEKIIVAGGNGFIGSHLVKKLIKENHEIFILDADINYFNPLSINALKNIEWRKTYLTKGAKVYQINLSNINQIRKIVRDIRPSHIINLAALPLAKNAIQDTDDAFNSIIVNAKNFMEVLRNEKIQTKFTHISSSILKKNQLLKKPKKIQKKFMDLLNMLAKQ